MSSYVREGVRKEMATHTLEVHVDTPLLKAWYLRPPNGGRMQSTYILETVEGIVIMGDWCPESNRGAISCYGYGMNWFSSKLGEDYLCSKFLRQEWVPAVGLEGLRYAFTERDDPTKYAEALRDAERAYEYGELTYERAHEIFTEAGLSDFEDLGHDYNPRDAGILCAIQQRFAELYRAPQTPRNPESTE
jgi:hypothetical protein